MQNHLPDVRGALETLSTFNSSEHRYFPRRLSDTIAWNKCIVMQDQEGAPEWRRAHRSAAYLHGGAYRERKLTEWCFQDVDQRHGDKDLLSVQDVPVIQHHVDAKHSEGDLHGGEKRKQIANVDLAGRDLSGG